MKTLTFLALSLLAFYFVTINEYFIAFLILAGIVLAIMYQAFRLPEVSGASTVVHSKAEENIGGRIGSIFNWIGKTISIIVKQLGGEEKEDHKEEHKDHHH